MHLQINVGALTFKGIQKMKKIYTLEEGKKVVLNGLSKNIEFNTKMKDEEKKFYKEDRKNITKELNKMKPEYYNMVLEYLKD